MPTWFLTEVESGVVQFNEILIFMAHDSSHFIFS